MKQKTKKALTSRFRITKTGKLMRRRQNSRHLRSNKSRRQKRKFKVATTVSPSFAKKIVKLINI